MGSEVAKSYTAAPSINPFDYTSKTYDGQAKRFFDSYQTLQIYEPYGFVNRTSIDLGSYKLPGSGTESNTFIGEVSATGRTSGYRYANSKVADIKPAYVEMSLIGKFLQDYYVEADPDAPTGPTHDWWKLSSSPTDSLNWRRTLQRLIFDCFDAGSQARAFEFGKTPKGTYKALCSGLINKTHDMGSAAPHHFDVLLTIINAACVANAFSDSELETLFGKSDVILQRLPRLASYTRRIGVMCSGFAGNFARYATTSSRPGADVDPIGVIATTNAERTGKKAIPKRWNLAGMEGAQYFGGSADRASVADVKPGDCIVHVDAAINHVLIIDSVTLSGAAATIATAESCGDGTKKSGMAYSTGRVLEKIGSDFFYTRFGSKVKCTVRRISHWPTEERHDLSDIYL